MSGTASNKNAVAQFPVQLGPRRRQPAPAALRMADRRRRAGGEHNASLYLFPAVALSGAFLALPLGATLWLSLSPNVLIDFVGPGVQNYAYLLGKAYYAEAVLRTMRLAAEATAIALAIGYPAALATRGLSERVAGKVGLAIMLPVLSGPLVVILGWMILLSHGGPLTGPLERLGLPVRILGSEAGILIGMVHQLLPFVLLSLAGVLRSIPASLLEAAGSLGASEWHRFRHIIFPLSLPGLLSAVILAFSWGTGAYIVPHYLGGVADLTLTMLVVQFMTATYNGQLAATAAMILMAVMAVAIFVLTVLVSRRIRG